MEYRGLNHGPTTAFYARTRRDAKHGRKITPYFTIKIIKKGALVIGDGQRALIYYTLR
jgi:hypothetical protein